MTPAARREALFWAIQRVSAFILAFAVLVHLATILYAVKGGLTAAEILGRTQGSLLWAGFYTAFVFAIAIHGAIGLRTIAAEWLGFRGGAADFVMALVGAALMTTGLRAVVAVFGA